MCLQGNDLVVYVDDLHCLLEDSSMFTPSMITLTLAYCLVGIV